MPEASIHGRRLTCIFLKVDGAKICMLGTPFPQFLGTSISAAIIYKNNLVVLPLHGINNRVTEKFNIIDLIIERNYYGNIRVHQVSFFLISIVTTNLLLNLSL